MAELYGVNTDTLIGGLAGAGANAAGYFAPMFDFSKVVAPALDPAAMAAVAAPLAEEGANAANGLVSNIAVPGAATGTVEGLAGSYAANAPISYGHIAVNTPVLNDAAKMLSVDNPLYDPNWKPEGPGMFDKIKGYGTDTMKFFNDNSKGLEAGGKLVGGLGGLYYQNQMAGLAKQQLNDSRANTAYNRARQAAGDANLQSASDRVFGKYNV